MQKESHKLNLSPNNNSLIKNNGEVKIIQKLIGSGHVVFDIGANIGTWAKEVLNNQPNVQIHVFEPVVQTYQTLIANFDDLIEKGTVTPNNYAVADREEIRQFYYYENASEFSTFYRRDYQVEKSCNLQNPQVFSVRTTTIDSYCQKLKIERINFVKIDVEGSELEVIQGAKDLLAQGKIDYIQFEYGGTFLEAGTTLEQIFAYLSKFSYTIFKILPNGLEYKPKFIREYENFEYSNFLAVNKRLGAKMWGEVPKMLDLRQLCAQHSVIPRGVIHIGAHEGQEIELYKTMGIQKMLFIEANPVVFERLKKNIAGVPNLLAVNCAISNQNGAIALHIASQDQSSSILPLKKIKEIYPSINETQQVIVQSKTLDTLLQELQLSPSEFNILNLDIQGAELLALQGATNTLKYIEAINTEVNYQELYEGCALVDQIDEFLKQYDFERVALTTPYHPSWGDAFYVKPVITMSTLGKNGRFANQIFQYAFLKIYAKQHHLRVATPDWIGQDLFGHKDAEICQKLPVLIERTNKLEKSCILSVEEPFKNVDLWGYFQYQTQYYAGSKDYFRSLFKPVPEILNKMQKAGDRLRSKGKTIVGLHLRRGDYGYGPYYIAPSEWYKEWLANLWETLDQPVLFIASDELNKVVGDFVEYNPVTVKDLEIELPQADFYPDFYLLSQCDIVAISNSSFSFAACMLNEQATIFLRPDLETQKLIAFDPWDSKPILEEQEFCVPININIANLPGWINQYQKPETYQVALANLRQTRQQVAEQLLDLDANMLEGIYLGEVVKIHYILTNSGLKHEPLTIQEQAFVDKLINKLAKGVDEPKAINYLLAVMLYLRADQLSLPDQIPVPAWLSNDYLKFRLISPTYFQEVGEIENYYKYLQQFLNWLHKNIFEKQDAKDWQNIAAVFTNSANFLQLYFVEDNLKDIYKKRADILEFTLKQQNFQLNYVFPDRQATRKKIRLGILNSHFEPQTETFSTIPVFEYLDREQFEIILYALRVNNHPLEQYCQSRADKLVKLPENFVNQIQKIRGDDLDILLIGTNLTAIAHNITLLALHRLARIQVTSVSSPVTTGIRNIDYYISGQLTESLEDAQQNYCEQLRTIEGAAHCFNYTIESEVIRMKPDRKSLGISEDAVVFISGANFYKIIPELRETWAKIIAAVPNSVLVLYPFGYAWSPAYPKIPFLHKMRAIFTKYGIDPNRFVLLPGLPSRADVKEHLKLAEVYLDSFPYTGANSTIDPLEVGLPTLVMNGNSFRSRQAAAILQDLKIVNLIVENEQEYIELAIALGTTPKLRQHYRALIQQKMPQNPGFLDSRSYAAKIGNLFQNLFQEWLETNLKNSVTEISKNLTNERLQQPVDSAEFLNHLAGCVSIYEIDPTDAPLLEELRQIRRKIAEFWLSANPDQLDSLLIGDVGKGHQALLDSGIKNERLTENETLFLNELLANLDGVKANNYRLAAMLFDTPREDSSGDSRFVDSPLDDRFAPIAQEGRSPPA